MTDTEMESAIRQFTNPQQHDDLLTHGWESRNGIWQPQYSHLKLNVPWIPLASALRVHEAAKAYGQAEQKGG